MDILAAMLAYLGCVTGIIAALAFSFVMYFSPPHHATPSKQTVAMFVQQSAAKAAPTPQQANAGATAEQLKTQVVSTVAQGIGAPQKAAAASSASQVQGMRTQYFRRLVQEERAKRWAYQQDPSFENRFLGYAD